MLFKPSFKVLSVFFLLIQGAFCNFLAAAFKVVYACTKITGLAKTILQGTVQRGRRIEGPTKEALGE